MTKYHKTPLLYEKFQNYFDFYIVYLYTSCQKVFYCLERMNNAKMRQK